MTVHQITLKPRFGRLTVRSTRVVGIASMVLVVLISAAAFIDAGILEQLFNIIQTGIFWIGDTVVMAILEFISIISSSYWMF